MCSFWLPIVQYTLRYHDCDTVWREWPIKTAKHGGIILFVRDSKFLQLAHASDCPQNYNKPADRVIISQRPHQLHMFSLFGVDGVELTLRLNGALS